LELLSHIELEDKINNGKDGYYLSLSKWSYICEAIKNAKFKEDIHAIFTNSREMCGLCYKYKTCDQCLFDRPCYEYGSIKEATEAIYEWYIRPNKKNRKEALIKSINVLHDLIFLGNGTNRRRTINEGNLIRVDFKRKRNVGKSNKRDD
jgi:hypothetical protein